MYDLDTLVARAHSLLEDFGPDLDKSFKDLCHRIVSGRSTNSDRMEFRNLTKVQ